MKRPELILASVIDECRKHQSRLDYASRKLIPKVPFTANENLSDEFVASLDQYIFRFSKLQDGIGGSFLKDCCNFWVKNHTTKCSWIYLTGWSS